MTSILIINQGDRVSSELRGAADIIIENSDVVKTRNADLPSSKPLQAGDIVRSNINPATYRMVLRGEVDDVLSDRYGRLDADAVRLTDGESSYAVTAANWTKVGHVSDPK